MNTDLLRTFLEISKTRHFGRAAENLFLTQSAVSFRIKQLEDVVGVKLFTRERNNILLTTSGERLLPHAENLLAGWQAALQDVGVASQKSLQISIGGTSNLWDTFLQSLLPQMAGAFPGLYLRTEINPQRELTRALLSGRLDIAVLFEPPKVSELCTSQIGEMELMFVTSEKVTCAEDIERLGYIFVDWGTAFNLQHAKFFDQAIAPVLHTGQSHIALEFLLAHGGAAFLPVNLIEPLILDKKLFEVEHIQRASRSIFAVFNEESENTKAFMPIIDFLTKRAAKTLAT
ncbi:MAG: LysR family transcriptional regulator [Cellvibrionaceae bacterium]|nr:LysR family transcriptional regulator [Cellvibrionaceae bacterium]|tara:strand:- start:3292 stop:4155 length:864 start_codon:yes stop_codon:yes gene_type:complete